ncbi:hypothetical protein Tco_0999562 [Tanacetum coccineum]
MTYPEEFKETLGTLVEEEPLDYTKLEDVGLDTCNHGIPLSSREVPSFDEQEPQPQPLPNCPSLDVSLGDERGPAPPIKQHSPDSFRMKEVDHLTIHTPSSPHVAYSYPNGMIKDDCELESKEVSFLGRGLTLPVKPKEVILDEESPEVLWKLEGGVK